MPTKTVLISCVVLLQLFAWPGGADAGQRSKQKPKAHPVHKAAPAEAAIDEQMLATQVMLDRAGYSPGEIDAVHGSSTDRALAAFTKDGGKADAEPPDVVTTYTITEQDVAGPFTPSIPSHLMRCRSCRHSATRASSKCWANGFMRAPRC
jgi:hypothetical protein